ncbi:hypothetical protein [Blattabacterium cuenoti]|uniref:hypothetical protein n=1 Tax=Blattabacterium cuenoti TaxID=1653831 RepID=UPI001EEAA50A|nr:hypothetical protein [Blattabacterium cuenoti]
MNTIGFHAFSITLCAFLRSYVIQLFNGNHFTNKKYLSVYHLSFLKKICYIFSIVILHNITLWTLESFKNIHNFHSIFFLRKIFISIFTTILCIIYFFFRRI